MTVQAWLMVAILAGLFVLLALDRLPSWLVFMVALTACMTFGLAPPEALLKGFGNVGVVTVAALFPVAAGMYSTGAMTLLSQHVIGKPRTLGAAQLRILPPITIGSGFLNNTPLVAMMIPITRDLARTTGLAPSKLLMGISFASILGGTITLIGTSVNLIVAGLTSNAIASGQLHGMKPLGLFAPAWVGLPVAVAGVFFMIVVGTRLLPGERHRDAAGAAKRLYQVEFRIEAKGELDGKTLDAAGFTQSTEYQLLSVSRGGNALPLAPDLRLQGEDRLALAGPLDAVAGLWATNGLLPAFGNLNFTNRHRNQLVELVVSPRAPAVGRLVSEIPVPDGPYRAAVVGVSHDGEPPEGSLDRYRVQAGDAGILEVPEAFFYENRRELDFVLIKAVGGFELQRADRALVALGITGAMMALTSFNVTTMLNAALLATGAMLVTGCLTIRRAWESVDWRTVVTLGAAVGLEPALTQSGLSEVIAQMLSSIGGNNAMLALSAAFLATLLATNIIGHAAAAVMMFPVALSMASRLGVSFMPFAVALMMGASCAFINPAGFQTNLMVQEPGGYSFGDYVRVGVPLTILVAVVVLLIVPVAYRF